MFRNPRENAARPQTDYIAPSVGRPPSPPGTRTPIHPTTARAVMETLTSSPAVSQPLPTLGRGSNNPRKGATVNRSAQKPKGKPNGSILAFFKKSGEEELFLQQSTTVQHTRSRRAQGSKVVDQPVETDDLFGLEDAQEDYDIVPNKRQKLDLPCGEDAATTSNTRRPSAGPFLVESDDDSDDETIPVPGRPLVSAVIEASEPAEIESVDLSAEMPWLVSPPPLPVEETSFRAARDASDGIIDVDAELYADFEDDVYEEGEEYVERRWMEEQARLEFEEVAQDPNADSAAQSCPICSVALNKVTSQQAEIHVNNCLDGNPTPLPEHVKTPEKQPAPPATTNSSEVANRFRRPPREPKPGQANPFAISEPASKPAENGSAFSKLMSGHAEDAAWAEAAAAEHAARGKPAYQRTCPFYKILPGFNICVDAFRYGAVKGCEAYFLSHFHSDHYIGLTAHWCHGPIYCSKVTGNLVKQQLRVDPKYVVCLDWEQKVEVPGTNGVFTTMISANHCPGSSLYLFEKTVGKGANPKVQRVLHCGDFRACRAHVEHPLLRPEIMDAVKGKSKKQKLDVCYLDTTYLNPKYAFPSQESVIKACADMCVSLNKHSIDDDDGWEQMKRERAGAGMVKFVRKASDPIIKQEPEENGDIKPKIRGRLLVIVGTYSIGKERICLGIARALNSKVYAPAGKLRICRALEDPELDALLTTNPAEAQVHMTPLFEIRAETLDDYLKDYSKYFSRAVGFRPSGWNYRPPNSRFTESPSVQTILHSDNWKSTFSMKDLVPQRGSTSRASCFGVPYSEHSSFRELTMFCCALNIDKIIPTVNIGNAKSRERMKGWCTRWANDRQKNGLFKVKAGEAWS